MSEDTANSIREGVNNNLKNSKMTVSETAGKTTESGGAVMNVSQPKDGTTIGDGTGETNQAPTDQNTNPLDNHANDKNTDNHANDKNTGQIPDPKEPADWGHFDDDKFKIQDGDIIEYLMKEVILESAAWCLNKVSGIAGVLAYEAARAGYRSIVKPVWEHCVAEPWNNFVNWAWNGITGKNKKAPAPANNNQAGNYQSGTPNASIDNFNLFIQGCQARLQEITDPKNKARLDDMRILRLRIAQGYVSYKDGQLICADSGNPYPGISSFSEETFNMARAEGLAEYVTLMKQQATEAGKSINMSDEQLKDYIEKQQAYNVAWFQHTHDPENHPKPERPNLPNIGNDYFQTAYEKADATINDGLNDPSRHVAQILTELNVDTDTYAAQYAQYKMSEMYRDNPDNYYSGSYNKTD